MKAPNSYRIAAAFVLTFALGCTFGYLISDHGSPVDAGAASGQQFDTRRGNPLAGGANGSASVSHAFGIDPADAAPTSDFDRRIIAALRARDYFQRRFEIYALGQKLDATTIRTAMEATQTLNPSDRDSSQYVLLARWLELDPAAAYDWVKARPEKNRRSDLLREFFHSLGLKDPATALTYLGKHGNDPSGGTDYTYSVFEAWSSADPLAATEAAFALANKESRGSALQNALSRLAKKDPQVALQRIASLPDESERQNYRRVALRAWAEEDPEAARAHAETLTEGAERNEALGLIMRGTAVKDPALAAQLIERIPPGRERSNVLSDIVRELGYKEPAAMVPFILAMTPTEQRNSMHQVINSLARQDPLAALDFAGKLSSLEARSSAMRMAIQQWTQTDPKAAVEHFLRANVGTPDDLGSAFAGWARKNAMEALESARKIPEGPRRDAALQSAISAMGGANPQEGIRLATSLLPPEKQSNVLMNLAGAWASKDPAAAADWVMQAKNANVIAGAGYSIINTWARKDPVAAAKWVDRTGNADHASTVVREWANVDPGAAAKWMERLPTGNGRDQAIGAFTRVVLDTDPAGAAAWAEVIAQPAQRENAISEVYRKWKGADPNAAETWLRGTQGVSEQTRERMLKSNINAPYPVY